MFNIDKEGKIQITKGDNGEAELLINSSTIEDPILYEVQQGDTIHFYAYPKASFYERDAFIHKTLNKSDVSEEGLVIINFIPSDTANIKPGEYLYRCKLLRASGKVDTVIEENTFIIKP